MKKLLVAVGVVLLCVIVTGVAGFSIISYRCVKLDKSSKAYIDEVIPRIISSWNSQELISRASPEFLNDVPKEKLDNLFKWFSARLGTLKIYAGSKGSSFIKISPSGKIEIASYVAQSVFEKGEAQIKIDVIQHNNKWQMLGFYVNSPALFPTGNIK